MLKQLSGWRVSFFAVVMMVVAFAAPVSSASATSVYDGLLQPVSPLVVYTNGSAKTQTMDISDTWWTDFKQTYALRVAQNIGWPSDFVSEFETIRASGGSWGVISQEDSTGVILTIVGTGDPNASCSFEGPANSDRFVCTGDAGYSFVIADYFTHSSYGNNGCFGSYGWRCSDNGMNVYSAPSVSSGGGSFAINNGMLPSANFHFMNFEMDYPVGYAGQDIQVPTSLYTGSVDCANSTIEYMLITQDGTINPVILYDESAHRASWTYRLSNSPYSITVGCGTKIAVSYGSTTPMLPIHNDWMCDDTMHNPPFCVLV